MLKRVFTAIAILCVLCVSAAELLAVDVLLDAAQVDRHGVPFAGYAAVRPIVDNSAGAEDLTSVRFKIAIKSGTLDNIGNWAWDDANNPWYGARGPSAVRPDAASYTQGIVYYPPTQDWAPYFFVDPTPLLPASDDEYELFDVVPAGMTWDVAVKLMGLGGGDIDLFSIAEGQLTSNQLTATCYDSDTGPQTVPEPAAMGLLAVGAAAIAAHRRRRPRAPQGP